MPNAKPRLSTMADVTAVGLPAWRHIYMYLYMRLFTTKVAQNKKNTIQQATERQTYRQQAPTNVDYRYNVYISCS